MNTRNPGPERKAGGLNLKNKKIKKPQKKKISTNKVTSDVQVLAWKQNMKTQDNRSLPQIIHPIKMEPSKNDFKELNNKKFTRMIISVFTE